METARREHHIQQSRTCAAPHSLSRVTSGAARPYGHASAEASGTGAPETELTFHRYGSVLYLKQISAAGVACDRELRPACRKLNMPTVGWHSFRHTHATLLTEVGESIKTTRAILGHKNLESTLNIYSHPIRESQRRAIERVAQILDPNGRKFDKPETMGSVN